MPDEDKTVRGFLNFGFENLMTSRAHTLSKVRIVANHSEAFVIERK